MNHYKEKKCEICGTKENVMVMVGGLYTYLCKSCMRAVEDGIRRYKRYLRTASFEDVVELIMKDREV